MTRRTREAASARRSSKRCQSRSPLSGFVFSPTRGSRSISNHTRVVPSWTPTRGLRLDQLQPPAAQALELALANRTLRAGAYVDDLNVETVLVKTMPATRGRELSRGPHTHLFLEYTALLVLRASACDENQ